MLRFLTDTTFNLTASDMTAARKQTPQLPMNAATFLQWPGDGTGRRFELVDGLLRAMAPTSNAHGIILVNIASILQRHIKAKGMPCMVGTGAGVAPSVRADWNVLIPDVYVTCTKASGEHLVPMPILLVEVLSPSNAADTRENVLRYETIASVQEILIVDSRRAEASVRRRDADGRWTAPPEHLKALDAQVELRSLGYTGKLASFYDDTLLAQ
jgi:Uma2 family endonuclease